MKKVYICSPYASQGERKQNLENAKEYCRQAIQKGYIPIAPHVFYTQILNDDIAGERAAGLQLGIELLRECDEIWVFGRVLGGMVAEVQMANKLGLSVHFIQRDGSEWEWPRA